MGRQLSVGSHKRDQLSIPAAPQEKNRSNPWCTWNDQVLGVGPSYLLTNCRKGTMLVYYYYYYY